MHQFTLSRPTDISAAIVAHAQNAQLAFIAGGTDLIGLMKDRVTLPDHLLDINRLPDMAQIEALSDGGLRIGALAWIFTASSQLTFWAPSTGTLRPGGVRPTRGSVWSPDRSRPRATRDYGRAWAV